MTIRKKRDEVTATIRTLIDERIETRKEALDDRIRHILKIVMHVKKEYYAQMREGLESDD